MAQYKVWHPSGDSAVVTGKFGTTPTAGIFIACTTLVASSVPGVPPVREAPGVTLLINPLCVVVDVETGKICYTPRQKFFKEFYQHSGMKYKEWLASHPEWPGVLELESFRECSLQEEDEENV